jgi:hypothetical protein
MLKEDGQHHSTGHFHHGGEELEGARLHIHIESYIEMLKEDGQHHSAGHFHHGV